MKISGLQIKADKEQRGHLGEPNSRAVAERLVASIQKYCEVIPVLGPESPIQNQAFLNSTLDAGSFDTILLAHQYSAFLISEDDRLRSFGEESGLRNVVRFQAALRRLRDVGAISQGKYSRIVLGKVASGDTFINLSFTDLQWGALQDPDSISHEMFAVIGSFSRPGLDLPSIIGVYGKFIRCVVEHLEPNVIREYHSYFLEALRVSRPKASELIGAQLYIQLRAAVQDAKLSRLTRRRLGVLLRRLSPRVTEHTRGLQEQKIDLRKAVREVNRSMLSTGE